MALIKCPECGREISDTAKNCIHCGYVLKEENNVLQPQTVVIAPEKGKTKKSSLNIGVTIILVVVAYSLVTYLFGWLVTGGTILSVSNWPQLDVLISKLVIPAIISVIMAILIFSVPKLRKTWFKILYILISITVLPLTVTFVISTLPVCIAYITGVVFIIKSIIIKE